MHCFIVALAVLASISGTLAASSERVLGVYIFHRHGDRTAKAWTPVNLTALGAQEVFASGSYYRSRYISADSDMHINGLSSGAARPAQLSILAPSDVVLQNSAAAFTQAIYPPSNTSETLANGTQVEAPLGGFQYIPVGAVTGSASSDENSAWLQGSSGCKNAMTSSNAYYSSSQFMSTAKDSAAFYQGLLPVVNGTFNSTTATFKNAYTVWDLINVATIHNATIPSDGLLTTDTMSRAFDLASTHEWNLAYNETDAVRAIAGAVLAGQIIQSLQAIVAGTSSTPKLNVQFGAYGTFMSFFGLAQLQNTSGDFYGITNYASSMTFELYTTSTDAKPSSNDMQVRFLYSNGTASSSNLKQFPLFGQTSLSWKDFQDGMSKFAITSTGQWCSMCGSTDGLCAAASSPNAPPASSNQGHGMSNAVAGVIGAFVTLGVILILGALIALIGGCRITRKKRATHSKETAEHSSEHSA